MPRRRLCALHILTCLLVLGGLGCEADDNPESNTEGRIYYLNGQATGVLAEFTRATCLKWPTGNPSLQTPHIEVTLTFGDPALGDPPRFSPFLELLLVPLPSDDRVRKAAVIPASTYDADYETRFEFSAVAAEYEYGVPLKERTSLWLHRLTIPEQTFVHPRDGEITVGGELDGLFIACSN